MNPQDQPAPNPYEPQQPYQPPPQPQELPPSPQPPAQPAPLQPQTEVPQQAQYAQQVPQGYNPLPPAQPTPQYQAPTPITQQAAEPQINTVPPQQPTTPPPPPYQPAAAGMPEQPKYKLFKGIADTVKAINFNKGPFILSVISSYLLAGLMVGFLSLILILGLFSQIKGANTNLSSVIIVLIVVTILSLIATGAALALPIVWPSKVVNAGAQKIKISSGWLYKNSGKELIRVMKANILFMALTYLPVILFILLPVLFTTGRHDFQLIGTFLIISIFSLLASMVWLYIVILRFSLVPFIALFEPTIPIKQTFRRSNQLLTKGGQWFLLKGIVLALLIYGFAASTFGRQGTVVGIVSIILAVFSQAVLVVLYRNRVIAKSNLAQETKVNLPS